MATKLVVSTVFKAKDQLTAAVRRMTKSVKTFSQKSVAAFRTVQRAEQRMRNSISKKLGSVGMVIGAAAIFGAVQKVISVFATFEQANAGLAAVMGKTVEQTKALAADAKRLGSITASTATEVVGLQEAFARLGFTEPEILNMTQSTISGAVAMKAELADTAELVGAMVRSFDKFSSIDAPDIIDQMTLSTQKSALNFEKLQTALPIVSGAANAAGVPFTKLLALLGKLSDAGIDASSSATALRNIFIDSASKGHSYEQILKNIQKNQDKLTAANDKFGKRGAVSAAVLANNLEGVTKLDAALKNAAGTAQTAADKQLNTLTGRMTLLKSAWEGFVLSLEDGTGKFSTILKTIVEVSTEMLAMASGTSKAADSLHGLKIKALAENGLIFLNVLKWIVITFVAFKLIVGAVALAMGIYKAALVAITVAQWAWNAALALNPIGLIIIAVVALIALIAVVIAKYNDWGAAVSFLLGPLGWVINLIQAFRRNWDMVKKAFSTGGLLGGLKAIGKVILDSLLMPVQQLLMLLAKIPGMDILLNPLIAKVQSFREGLGVNTATDESGDPLNADAEIEKVRTERIERTENQKMSLDINNNTGFAAALSGQFAAMPVELSDTNSWPPRQ
jgi:hypothetical protein